MPRLVNLPQSKRVNEDLDDADEQDGEGDSIRRCVEIVVVLDVGDDRNDGVDQSDQVNDDDDCVVEGAREGAKAHEEEAGDGDDDVRDDRGSAAGRSVLAIGRPAGDDCGDEGDEDVDERGPVKRGDVAVEEDAVAVDEVVVKGFVDDGW